MRAKDDMTALKLKFDYKAVMMGGRISVFEHVPMKSIAFTISELNQGINRANWRRGRAELRSQLHLFRSDQHKGFLMRSFHF
jgi:hypothetical protein